MAKLYQLNIPEPPIYQPDICNGSIFFVGTATVIIRYAGFTILTDPNFLHAGDHIHIGYGLTSERLTNPAIEFDELPPIDFCLLSHHHEDHFDRIVAERLDRALPIITTAAAAKALKKKGFRNLYPLRSWDLVHVRKGNQRALLTATPGKHAPGVLSHLLPQVMGSLVEFLDEDGRSFYKLYISGDTIVFDELKEIPARHPDIDLALMHLGGAKVLRLMTVTMDAEQGVEALRIIRPQAAIPIHYNDYSVFKSPLSDFKEAVSRSGLPVRIVYLSHGDTYGFTVEGCQAKAA